MNLLKYLLHRATWEKLPMTPRMYSTEFDPAALDDDTITLMSQTHTRCPQGVEVLKRRHGAKTALELIERLPAPKRKRHIMGRVMAVYRRAFGLTAYDPMKSIARQQMRKGKR